MPKRAAHRLNALSRALVMLVPAWMCFALAAFINHPLSLILVLIANAIAMTAVCNSLGFGIEGSFSRSVARRGLAYFVLLTAYTAFVAAVLAAPAWWLTRDDSLPAALALSAALMVGLFALWRIWPAFALPLLWDDAYPHDEERGSWLWTALLRSLAFARHLTREHEFFVLGLPATIGLLLLSVGALALVGLGGFITGDLRVAATALYALVVSPLVHLLIANRSLRALLADVRSARRQRDVTVQTEPTIDETPLLPHGIGSIELAATLLCAARSAQTNLALAALERGADPDALPTPDLRDQRSALMIAVTLPDQRLLRALIAKRADVNRIHGGITPLIAATRDSHQGRPEAVTTLLANGADPRSADSQGSTPLHHAARCADPIVAALLLDAGADVNVINNEGMTALAIASSHASWDIVRFLLERGAKPDLERAQPALMFAAGIADDDPAGVKLLLKQRANVDVRAALERTPLMAAALAGNSRIVDALLAAGASTDLADHRGTTALMEAARAGAVAAIHALGKRQASPDAVDANGRSALIIACLSRHASEDVVRALLALGADRARAAADGKRALDHAAAAGRWHIVALLDPAYPLPSSLAHQTSGAQAVNPDHLLDALRFGHWNVAAEFIGVLDAWPSTAFADLYLDLADAEHAHARLWLFNHGLNADAIASDGCTLLNALLAQLPSTVCALGELLARGASMGGAGLLARVLACMPGEANQRVALRELATQFLDRGADACGWASGERSALQLAVAAGEVPLVTRLLDLGADPNARDAHGRTPLHMVFNGEREVAVPLLRLLVDAGANPEIADATGETPLGLALASTQPQLAYWLNWSSWRLPLRRLRAADLPAAAALGDLDAVNRLIALGHSLDGEDAQGATALIRAAGSGHAALVVRLLEAGADTTRAARSGIHCLAAAVSAKREAVVRTLLSHGIEPDARIGGGGTALTLASALGEIRIAEALLEAGADVNACDEQGTTPLHAAAQCAFDNNASVNARALFERLLRAGARLDARNRSGQDALLIVLGARAQAGAACDAEHLLGLTDLLLQNGAPLDSQDLRGVSALHACALHGLLGCARLLKAHGAPLNLLDGFERSAAQVAALLGYVDVAAELDTRGAATLPSARQTLRRPARAPE